MVCPAGPAWPDRPKPAEDDGATAPEERARKTAPGFALDEVPVSPVNTTLAARLIAKKARAALRLRYAVNDFQFLARCHRKVARECNSIISKEKELCNRV
jgi:hypothetical protein